MSLLRVVVNTNANTFNYELINPNFKFLDVEMLFSAYSDISDILFGFDVLEDGAAVKHYSFNSDFAYTESQKNLFFNSSRIEYENPNAISFNFWFEKKIKIESSYDLDIELPNQPFESWILTQNGWAPPHTIPSDEYSYRWDEGDQSWIRVEWLEDINQWVDVYE